MIIQGDRIKYNAIGKDERGPMKSKQIFLLIIPCSQQ